MAALVITSITTILLTLGLFKASRETEATRRVIPSPRETLLPQLNDDEVNALAYPPTMFPGARDVDTPYGKMRVYEWGPEDGKKVVLIHGDATPSPLFAPIAKALVDRGYRVMLFGKAPGRTLHTQPRC